MNFTYNSRTEQLVSWSPHTIQIHSAIGIFMIFLKNSWIIWLWIILAYMLWNFSWNLKEWLILFWFLLFRLLKLAIHVLIWKFISLRWGFLKIWWPKHSRKTVSNCSVHSHYYLPLFFWLVVLFTGGDMDGVLETLLTYVVSAPFAQWGLWDSILCLSIASINILLHFDFFFPG